MHPHHRRAWVLIGWAVLLDIAYGLLFALAQGISYWDGLYFAVVTGTTTGYGDITPHGWLPHLVAVAIMVNVIPLITGCFSLVTSGLAGSELDRAKEEIKNHVAEQVGPGHQA